MPHCVKFKLNLIQLSLMQPSKTALKQKINKDFFFSKFYMSKSLSKFLIKSVVSKLYTMLLYNKIAESERLDTTVGTDVNRTVVGLASVNSFTFVTFTFSKIETSTNSLKLAMDIMTLLYMLKQ